MRCSLPLLALTLGCASPQAGPSNAEGESGTSEDGGVLSTGTGETGEDPPTYFPDLGAAPPESCWEFAPTIRDVEAYPGVGDMVANIEVTLPDGETWDLCNLYTNHILLKLAAYW